MSIRWISLIVTFAFISGCATYHPPLICTTDDLHGGELYYVDGIPYISFGSENTNTTITMSPHYISDTPVMKTSLTIWNNSSVPFDFNPGEHIKFRVIKDNAKSDYSRPIPPHAVQTIVVRAAEASAFATLFVGAVVSASQDYNNQPLDAAITRNSANYDAATITQLGQIRMQQMTNTMLRRNTVFPDQAITGFMFFDNLPKIWTDTRFEVTITLPDGEKSMAFKIEVGDWESSWDSAKIQNVQRINRGLR